MKFDFRPGDFVEVYQGNNRYFGLLLAFEKEDGMGQTTFPPLVVVSVLVGEQVRVFDVWQGEMKLISAYTN